MRYEYDIYLGVFENVGIAYPPKRVRENDVKPVLPNPKTGIGLHEKTSMMVANSIWHLNIGNGLSIYGHPVILSFFTTMKFLCALSNRAKDGNLLEVAPVTAALQARGLVFIRILQVSTALRSVRAVLPEPRADEPRCIVIPVERRHNRSKRLPREVWYSGRLCRRPRRR